MYDRPVSATKIVLIEGEHFLEGECIGGWFDGNVTVQLLVGNQWIDPPGGFVSTPAFDPAVPFQILEWELAQPVEASGVRVIGLVGGPAAFVTCSEIDILGFSGIPGRAIFDLDANGWVGIDDIYRWHDKPVDLDGDGLADADDLRYLAAAVRWRELDDMWFGSGRP